MTCMRTLNQTFVYSTGSTSLFVNMVKHMTVLCLLVVTFGICVIRDVNGYGDAVFTYVADYACVDMFPNGHGVPAQQSASPYVAEVPAKYTPGQGLTGQYVVSTVLRSTCRIFLMALNEIKYISRLFLGISRRSPGRFICVKNPERLCYQMFDSTSHK